MRKYLIRGVTLLGTLPLLFPLTAFADTISTEPQIILTEIKVKTDTTYDEFVEIYNASAEEIELSDYSLEYYNDYDTNVATTHVEPTLLPTGKLPSGSYFVLAHNQAQISDSGDLNLYTTSLKDGGGTLKIWGPDVNDPTAPDALQDSLSWASLSSPPEGVVSVGSSTNTTSKSQSLQRNTDEFGNPVVDDSQWSLDTPHPVSEALILPASTEEGTNSNQEDTSTDSGGTLPEENNAGAEPANQTGLLPIVLNELLPNPMPPQTDTLDEYVELYNPNDQAVDLTGYKVQTGNTYSYSYEFLSGTIPGHGYLTLTSGETNLALSNTGGKARLLDAGGLTISEAPAYEDASEGQAWALISGSWEWTTSPTPGAENSLTRPIIVPKSTKITKKAKAKKARVKSASTKKSKKPKSKATGLNQENPEDPAEIAPLHTGVLAVVGLGTLVYAGYEYRTDAANKLFQLRRYRESRRAARAATSGR
ncbi:MAG TPA: lamin tail domain-containing protein [Patescibacteria group bacterium]|nr:lamin tail domain-containing protein [Patescibacteria group bacterium]